MRSAMQPYAASCMSNVSLVRDGRARFTAGAGVSRVLLAVDDVGVLESLALDLAGSGIAVEAAPTADACMRALEWGTFELLVVELHLGSTNGLDLVRDLRSRGIAVPFVLLADHAVLADVVEAVRLGARTVVEKSARPEELVAAINRELTASAAAVETALASRDVLLVSGAPARRWAGYVLGATQAATDPRTLGDWSRAVGVSRSVLVESCARLGIVPRDARDLARVLRLVRRVDEQWDPEATLDVADRRTLRVLLDRAGLTGPALQRRPTPSQWLSRQTFVSPSNPGLVALRQLVDG